MRRKICLSRGSQPILPQNVLTNRQVSVLHSRSIDLRDQYVQFSKVQTLVRTRNVAVFRYLVRIKTIVVFRRSAPHRVIEIIGKPNSIIRGFAMDSSIRNRLVQVPLEGITQRVASIHFNRFELVNRLCLMGASQPINSCSRMVDCIFARTLIRFQNLPFV